MPGEDTPRASAPPRDRTDPLAIRPPESDLDATVDALCELTRRRGIEYAVEVGRTILDGVYGGDVDRLRARHKQCPSLRALAAHPNMPLSSTALHQAIHIYLLVERMPGVVDTELTRTHLTAVLPLTPPKQAELLSHAVAKGWTTNQLKQAVRAHAPRGRGGRPRLPRVVKTLHQLGTVAHDPAAWADLDAVGDLPADKQAALARAIDDLEAQLRAVRLQLDPTPDPEDT